MLKGIDINSNNWVSDWQKVKDSGIQVVINKATEGTYYTDKYLSYRQNICKQLEILFGVYHFAGHQDVSSEVNAFIGYISGMVFDTIHWLDIEQPPESYSWEWDKQTAVNFTNQFISLFISRTGKKIGVYTNKWLYENYLKGNIDPNTKLWIAAYGLSSTPYANTSWQYSASGFVPGIDGNVDLNWFAEDILAGSGEYTPPISNEDKLKEQIKALQYNLNIDYNAGLAVDGIAGPATMAALRGIQDIIVKGHKSHVILWIQQKLAMYGYLKVGTYTEMIYDESTFQAVTNLQKNWQRSTDGILGPETWSIFLTPGH
ncbi:GH25 family lysozyme [Clostridium luticellarii]|uniref:Autolytic lysozyme n=1 Tax=Clostridium luticellarii TaxID=1691940 RepID=A0A2T0BSM4_9CLOT|nr:GH25 family lysozyme [Clostridium luticellarii]PRR86898.1 Autolytic lysozyme [Clostridium luticellarii]